MDRKVLQQFCDVLTILCPAVITIVGTLEASGIIDLLGNEGAVVAAALGGITTVASVVFNVVTGYYGDGKDGGNERA